MKVLPHERISHSLFSHLVKLRNSSKYRSRQRTSFCRGRSITEDLLRCNTHVLEENASRDQLISIKRLIFSPTVLSSGADDGILSLVSNLPHEHRPQLYTSTSMMKLSNAAQVGEQEIIAEVGMPMSQDLVAKALSRNIKYLLVLDNVQDPLNVGSLLRSCLYLGWDGAVATNGSADFFNDKVIRSSMGAVYHVPVQSFSSTDVLAAELHKIDTLLAATPSYHDATRGADMDKHKIKHTTKCLVMGNEASGISPSLMRSGRPVSIPRCADSTSRHLQCDSLNVNAAGAILMQRLGPLGGDLVFPES